MTTARDFARAVNPAPKAPPDEGPEYEILGKYGREAAEVIDTAHGRASANYLVGEYSLAYGAGWRIWHRRKRG